MAGACAIVGATTGAVAGTAGAGAVAGAAGVDPGAVVGAGATAGAVGGVGSTACCRATRLTYDGAGMVINALLFVIKFSKDILNSQALVFS